MASPQVGQHRRLCLSALTADALSLLADQLARREVIAVRDLPAGLPEVMGDTVQLQQVVVNLVLNALQAMGDKLGSRVMLRTRAEGEEVVLIVEDNGPGIPPENLEKLFGSFFTTKADGMGIGLAICRTIVEAHGGSISVHNLDRGGAGFTVRLPSAQ
jgi:C4-dicarboxylate-specific signal transduction histidine kinase